MGYLIGTSSFRHVCIQGTISVFFFGDRHNFRMKKNSDPRHGFPFFIQKYLNMYKDLPVDIFTEYEYITRTHPTRLRINEIPRGTVQNTDPIMQQFYSYFREYLKIDKHPVDEHHFHYCDMRSRSLGPIVFGVEYIHILLELSHRYHSPVRCDRETSELLIHCLLSFQKDPEYILFQSKIIKQVTKWADQKERHIFLRWFLSAFQDHLLTQNEISLLENILNDQLTVQGDGLNILSKIRRLTNLLVDAYTIGRLFNPSLKSTTRIVYMGEDHIDEIVRIMTTLGLGGARCLFEERDTSYNCTLHTGHELLFMSQRPIQTG